MFLGIDLGTSSLKALLLTPEGETIAEAQASYTVEAPQLGWAETDPQAWWRAIVQATRQVVKDHGGGITALGLSGQMHGVVLCDAGGHPLRPAILWADRRSSPQLVTYGGLAAEQRRRLANPLTSGMAGPGLLWLKTHEPRIYQKAHWALQPKDWLRLRLTGEAGAEPSDASATLLYDLLNDCWANDIVESLGLRCDLLAPLIPSGSLAGTLLPEVATTLGLPADLPVATGAADTAAAALGGGLVHPGEMQLTVGSGAQLCTVCVQPHLDSMKRSHLFRTATPRGYYALAAMQNAGLALEWVRQQLGVSWREMYAEAFALPAGAEGVTFLPYLTGERTPHLNPDACGCWVGLKLHHTQGHLLRAAFEGVAFSLRDGLSVLQSMGHNPSHLRLAGGGTLEPEWRQLLADVLGKPLLALHVPAASARGAALLAGLATGSFRHVDETLALAPALEPVAFPTNHHPELEEAYQRYKNLYPVLNSYAVSQASL